VDEELIPGCAIRLLAVSASPEQAERVRRLFNAAWGRIPAGPQECLRELWDRRAATAQRDPKAPLVSLWSAGQYQYLCDRLGLPKGTIPGPAHVSADDWASVEIEFGRFLACPCDDWLQVAIAHELGHVFLRATNDPTHWAPCPSDQGPEALLAWDRAREEAVRQLLVGWGFPRELQLQAEAALGPRPPLGEHD
jgi:hypothetical protein